MQNVSPDPVTCTTTAIVVPQTSMLFKYMMYLLPLNQNYCTTTDNKPFCYHESLRCLSPTPEDTSRASDTRGSFTCCMQKCMLGMSHFGVIPDLSHGLWHTSSISWGKVFKPAQQQQEQSHAATSTDSFWKMLQNPCERCTTSTEAKNTIISF